MGVCCGEGGKSLACVTQARRLECSRAKVPVGLVDGPSQPA